MNTLEVLILLSFFLTIIAAENIPVCIFFGVLSIVLCFIYYILWRRKNG